VSSRADLSRSVANVVAPSMALTMSAFAREFAAATQ
jgi:hypothetical protein